MTGYTSEELAGRLMAEARFPSKYQKNLDGAQPDAQGFRMEAVRELSAVLQQAHRQGLILTVSDNMLNWLKEYARNNPWSHIAEMAYQVTLAHCQWYDEEDMEYILRLMKRNAPDGVFLDMSEEEFPRSAWEVVFTDIISSIWNGLKSIFRLRK